MSHKKLSPFIVKVFVLGYFLLLRLYISLYANINNLLNLLYNFIIYYII